MKRNLGYLIVTMSVALAGIILFQIYWISNSYDLHNQTFRNEANSALEHALSQFLEANTIDHILGIRDSAGDPIIIESYLFPVNDDSIPGTGVYADTAILNQPDMYPIRSNGGRGESARTYVHIERGDINKILSKVVISLANVHPDLRHLEEQYRGLLEQRNIRTPFFLAYSRNGEVYELTGGSTDLFATAQASQNLPGLGPTKEQVLAFFPQNRSYIFKRMWVTLLASTVLVGLISWIFIYMLGTILKQKKLSEIKNDFINNMTHELKTPISTVSAAMEALVNFNALDDKAKSLIYIDLSRRELGRLSGMVENVLRLSTFETQKLVLSKETFNLIQILEETAQQFLVQNPDRVRFEFDLKGPAYIHADKFHIQNVVSNLFDNAVKYSQETAEISVTCERTNEFIVFRVKDHGVGISKEQQQHIFEKFYRVPTGDLHAVKGFGLGLSYVRQIVEAHGGTIGVRSQPGSGSEFTVALPEIQ